MLGAFTEPLPFRLKLWPLPDAFAFRAAPLSWYGNGFNTALVLQATPNRSNEIQSIAKHNKKPFEIVRIDISKHFLKNSNSVSPGDFVGSVRAVIVKYRGDTPKICSPEVQRCTHVPDPPQVIICALGTSDREPRDPGRSAASCAGNIHRASSLSSSAVASSGRFRISSRSAALVRQCFQYAPRPAGNT